MEPGAAIPAATLIVVRERAGAFPELLMVERAQGMAFAGGALVFPGGRIDEGDRSAASDEIEAGAVAAIRETLEETAIPVGISPVPSVELAQQLQRELLADVPLHPLLSAHGLSVDVSALTPFARWVPKFHATRRFDTYFFIAQAPGGDWDPQIVEGECSAACWMSAQNVLERDRSGQARLIFPTRRNLERLAQHRDFASMRADAKAHAVEPITPWVEEVGGENFITIPGGIGYPVTREKLDGLWRG
jgi:8-oxo-dGTP pyrophosphatase MutT (NUDIX family)